MRIGCRLDRFGPDALPFFGRQPFLEAGYEGGEFGVSFMPDLR